MRIATEGNFTLVCGYLGRRTTNQTQQFIKQGERHEEILEGTACARTKFKDINQFDRSAQSDSIKQAL